MRIQTIIIAWLAATTISAQNTIVMGPGYERDQSPAVGIVFSIPQGWIGDEQAAKKAGVFAILLPAGKSLESTDRVITIVFQKKDPGIAQLATLTAFFRADLENTRAQFPGMQTVRWQPSGLDPLKLDFRSLEIFGGKTSPHRVLILEAPDGFFSITITTESREDLTSPIYESFFNSIKLP